VCLFACSFFVVCLFCERKETTKIRKKSSTRDHVKKGSETKKQRSRILKHMRIIYCILASCYIRLTLNICSFVHQCNTFTSYFLFIVDMFWLHTAIFRCYSILIPIGITEHQLLEESIL
jgi:hypothetical protein